MNKLFDLNIEKVLEHWGVEHAIREIIANALDEKQLTNTKDIEINFSNGICHIRDFGRGIQYTHFTQNENKEKLNAQNLIGKFGVGLKDALAVFYRNQINVVINSKYSTIKLTMADKSGFNLKTLHAIFTEPEHPEMIGTEVILTGVTKTDLQKAKDMFLIFNDNIKLLEKTEYGEVYQHLNGIPCIYANGIQIATEENFMFSYNITNMNSQMKKALNRERSNVGRTAYSDTIKNILKKCKSTSVLKLLVSDINNIMLGTNKDESGWVDIASYAAKTLNKSGNVVFMTPSERSQLTNQQVEILEQSGKELIMITDTVFEKIQDSVYTFNTVTAEYRQNFIYKFIDYEILNTSEKQVFDTSKSIIKLLTKKYKTKKPTIKISETIRMDEYGNLTNGIWDPIENSIIIKRNILKSKETFSGILIHEFAHYCSGHSDNTRDFENVLTEMLGYIYTALQDKEKISTKKSLFSWIYK